MKNELNGWIPVSERLPTADDADENGEVLVLLTPELMPQKFIFGWRSLSRVGKTTMWQPLPKLPEVKNGNN